jgi:hypothetical protein
VPPAASATPASHCAGPRLSPDAMGRASGPVSRAVFKTVRGASNRLSGVVRSRISAGFGSPIVHPVRPVWLRINASRDQNGCRNSASPLRTSAAVASDSSNTRRASFPRRDARKPSLDEVEVIIKVADLSPGGDTHHLAGPAKKRRPLVRHLRQAIDYPRYPLAPRLDPLKSILAKLGPPALKTEPLRPLKPGVGPNRGQGRRR